MALTLNSNQENKPIAKVKNSKTVIYLMENDNTFNDIPTTRIKQHTYECPYCKKNFTNKENLLRHLSEKKRCPTRCKKELDVFTNYKTTSELINIPSLESHEIIFASGPPACGKSYWINEYVKYYKKIFKQKKIFLFTRLEKDITLEKNIKNYNIITVNNSLVDDPFKLSDFDNSLCIFDDIESSEHKKGTNYIYNLLDDMCKNGRHHDISVIFANQECRMGNKTKPILTMVTKIVLFPKSGTQYQYNALLKEHMGMSRAQIARFFNLNSRTAVISRKAPQYILAEHEVYLINKDF